MRRRRVHLQSGRPGRCNGPIIYILHVAFRDSLDAIQLRRFCPTTAVQLRGNCTELQTRATALAASVWL